MKLKKTYQLLGVPLLMLAVSCGSDSDSSSSNSNTVNNGITSLVSEITASVNGAAGMYDVPESKKISQKIWGNKDAFSIAWTETTGSGVYDPRYEGDSMTEISIKEYLGIMLDEDVLSETDEPYAISPFSRTSEGLKIFCAIGVAMNSLGVEVDEFGYVDAGSYDFTFTADLKSEMSSTCEIDTTNIQSGMEANVVVTEGTAGGYERQFYFEIFNQKYWITNNATETKLASSEASNESGVSRQYIHINKTTGVTRAQYVSTTLNGQQGGVELFRIFWDETNDEAMVMGYRGRAGGGGETVESAERFILAGRPQNGENISVAFMKSGASATAYNGCANAETGDLTNDSADARCGSSGQNLDGHAITAIDTIISNFYTTYAAQAGSVNWGPDGLSESDEITFTNETDLVTTAFAP